MSSPVENANDPAPSDRSLDVALAGDVATATTDAMVDHDNRSAVVGTRRQALLRIDVLSDDPVESDELSI